MQYFLFSVYLHTGFYEKKSYLWLYKNCVNIFFFFCSSQSVLCSFVIVVFSSLENYQKWKTKTWSIEPFFFSNSVEFVSQSVSKQSTIITRTSLLLLLVSQQYFVILIWRWTKSYIVVLVYFIFLFFLFVVCWRKLKIKMPVTL